ncbi:MAG: ABC transporter permease [Bacteroidota bacterium]|nr:ABC transporter permease [Bacteroidota bacterium]
MGPPGIRGDAEPGNTGRWCRWPAGSVFGAIAVTHDFGKTVGWKISEGRDFSRAFPSDSGAFILNETALKLTGIKNPVGKAIRWNGKPHTIVGIVRDMVMESPYKPADPTFFTLDYGSSSIVAVSIKPTVPVREALEKIQTVFRKYNPGIPFEYQFTDEDYAKKFADEERIGQLPNIFAVLAIFISCLGLFGLASFIAEQRTREIGLRKVLGASVYSVWRLLSKEFVLLVVVSCLIAVPLSWHFLHQWLQSYEYHTG